MCVVTVICFPQGVCLFATGFKKAKTEGKKCHAKTIRVKKRR
jgi:hypothetical protein